MDKMITGDLDLPVDYHETFEVLDSSKIQTFMDCPRKFFFSYVLGWQTDTPNIHFKFGSGMHDAIEHLMINGLDEPEVLKAFEKFIKLYNEEYYDITGEHHTSKNPEKALDILINYAKNWRPHDNFKTLYTEISGSVPIDVNLLLYVKLDSIVKYPNSEIWSIEHKTTGRKTGAWMTKWNSKIQVGSYTHFLKVAFPNDNIGGIKINGMVTTKEPQFIRIPITLTDLQMYQWIWEVRHWVQQIKWNFEELSKCDPSDPIMTAFPRNTESCQKFGCPHVDLCNIMTNPLNQMDRIPLGYKKEFWDPRNRDKEAKTVIKAKGEDTEIIQQEPTKKARHDMEE